jgi:16S rRNA (guanine1207-N2)-methyltransferase
MSGALETLFFAADGDTKQIENRSIIFINACYHKSLDGFDKAKLYMQQYFRPYAKDLEKNGFPVYASCDGVQKSAYDLALILVPKNMIEARYLIAQGIRSLCDGGALICAADNNAGGTRLKKLLQGFGFEEPILFSRNKARAVRIDKDSRAVNEAAIEKAIKDGAMQSVIGGEYISQPGIYGWDKVDNGSRILIENLPTDLKGKFADFGCGYGYLSMSILANIERVKALYCIDADRRAVDACQKNVQSAAEGKCEVEYLWEDLTNTDSALKNLDHVVMNPPFHEGKTTDVSLGKAFISRAYESLRRGGKLWMVANQHLPYEQELTNRFFTVHKHYEGQGFKVYECLK